MRIIINSHVIYSGRIYIALLTRETTDKHRSGTYSSLTGPLVLVEGLGVALDVDLLFVEIRVLPDRVSVVLLVQTTVDVLIQFLRRARQPLAANRTGRLVRFSLPILNAYSGLHKRNGVAYIIIIILVIMRDIYMIIIKQIKYYNIKI